MDASAPNLIDWLSLEGDGITLISLDGRTCSRSQLGETVRKTQQTLLELVPESGHQLLTLLPDHPSTLPFQLAGISTSTVTVANPMSSMPEIAQLISETGVTTVVTSSPPDQLLELIEQLGLGLIELKPQETAHFADLTLELQHKTSVANDDHRNPPSLILTTSGSSGKPKIVPLTEGALMASATNIVKTLELTSSDTNVHMLPMFHIGAVLDLLIVPLMSGGQVCLAHPISAENLVRAIRENKPTLIQAVPTMLKALMRSLSADELRELGRSLRFIRSVSADLAPAVQNEIEQQIGVPVIQMYGMTETAGQICSNGLSEHDRKLGSVGRPAGCDVRILDLNGSAVPDGCQGEVCVAGESVFAGYANLDRPQAFHGKWFRTGDIGYFDDDGFLFLVGRTGDIINRGGEKLSSLEVEQKLLEHPSIAQAAAFSVPHETLGEDVGAVVVLSDDKNARDDDLRDFLVTRLSPYKIPRRLMRVEALPQLASGKIDKKACRDIYLNKPQMNASSSKRSDIGSTIASVWSDVLKQPEPSDNDDFFDSGGDSLAAHTLILTLEEKLGVTLPVNILFNSPTFVELEREITRLSKVGAVKEDEDEIFRTIRAATTAWPGARRDAGSLIIGLGDIGEKKPFFFCANGLQDYVHLAREMDPDRPFYAMRSLSLLPEKTPENIAKLAAMYAEEIVRLQPEGPISLGGHCGGANVARIISDRLFEIGRDVDLLVVIDRVFREICSAPALIIWTEESDYSHHSGAALYVDPALGVKRLFPLGATIEHVKASHSGLMHSGSVRQIAELVEQKLGESKRLPDDVSARVRRASEELKRRHELYKASISIKGRRLCAPNSHLDVEVTVTNLSGEDWGPTSESGFRLMAKWQRPGGKTYLGRASHAELGKSISAGETETFKLRVACRKNRTPLRLVVDLVDDGVAWFSWTGNPAAGHWVLPWIP